MTPSALLPCPFCGGRALLYDSVGGVFVSCELCEAQGPLIELEHVDYPESMLLKKQAIQKARATAAAAWNQRSAWQPIEAAPRDGTWVLAIWPDESRPRIVCFVPEKGWGDGNHSFIDFTHWQPLPSPPPITP